MKEMDGTIVWINMMLLQSAFYILNNCRQLSFIKLKINFTWRISIAQWCLRADKVAIGKVFVTET